MSIGGRELEETREQEKRANEESYKNEDILL